MTRKIVPHLVSILTASSKKGGRQNFTKKVKEEVLKSQKRRCSECLKPVSRWELEFDHKVQIVRHCIRDAIEKNMQRIIISITNHCLKGGCHVLHFSDCSFSYFVMMVVLGTFSLPISLINK